MNTFDDRIHAKTKRPSGHGLPTIWLDDLALFNEGGTWAQALTPYEMFMMYGSDVHQVFRVYADWPVAARNNPARIAQGPVWASDVLMVPDRGYATSGTAVTAAGDQAIVFGAPLAPAIIGPGSILLIEPENRGAEAVTVETVTMNGNGEITGATARFSRAHMVVPYTLLYSEDYAVEGVTPYVDDHLEIDIQIAHGRHL